ncbi:MAG: tetratricopeptide repeat protein [Sideroxydans sp.]
MLLLAGCASVTTQPTAKPAAPEAIPQGAIPQEAIPPGMPQPPAGAVVIEPVPKSDMSGNPAIIALLDRARLDAQAGKREEAGASLERALRIEPRNAWLWNELAQLRLAQGQYAQAITVAQKSISFAGRDRRLQAVNWRVIGNARVAQGDSPGAEQAFKRAAELEQ